MSQTKTTITTAYPSIAQLTESERHALLMDERRRTVLSVLAGYRTAVDLSTVATEVAHREDGCDASDATSVDRIRVTLHHMHLPKLESHGIVEYDATTNRIQPV
ncbi:DUF7344 domain-containing protein [Salinarchaeum laminariae]|uniref:DUF7344 domain-containing protein n=1 Tax=Salinarchaeum laminariae TaxID=869888 RepID=UPI0020BE915E|nr:hypothetical protein [Salinarchaeum laminariae]